MGRKPVGKIAMTSAERMRRHRLKHGTGRKRAEDDAPKLGLADAEKEIAALKAALAEAKARISRGDLSMSAQQKLDAAIRAHKKLLDREYDQRRSKEISDHLERIMPKLQEKQNAAFRREQTYREFLKTQKKIMTVAEFKLVRNALHPDTRLSATEESLKRAFQIFDPKKFALTGEK